MGWGKKNKEEKNDEPGRGPRKEQGKVKKRSGGQLART